MNNPFQPFNPSAQSTTPVQQPAPAQAAPVAYAPPAAPLSLGLDNPALYQGHNTPLLPHVEGRFSFRVVGVSGATSHGIGMAIHISLEVQASSCAQVPVGSTFRVYYKYDYVNNREVMGDSQGPVHAGLLGKFISALHKRDPNDPTFSKTNAVREAQTFDWSQVNARIDCHCELNRGVQVIDKKTKQVSTKDFRRELWLAAAA